LELSKNGKIDDANNVKRFLVDYLGSGEFYSFKNRALFDDETCAEIMKKYEAGNEKLTKKLVEPDAIADLLASKDRSAQALRPDQPVFTIEQLCKIIEQTHKTALMGALSKKNSSSKNTPTPTT